MAIYVCDSSARNLIHNFIGFVSEPSALLKYLFVLVNHIYIDLPFRPLNCQPESRSHHQQSQSGH